MKNEQDSIFMAYLQAFAAQRVEELTVEAEKQSEYIRERASIQEILDDVSRTVDAETLETLISAVRGADIPIYEYMYRTGLKDGIWLSDTHTMQNDQTPILERYINQIFRKQAVEYSYAQPEDADQIFYVRNEFSCFHTGLYTPGFKAIYMCFERNKKRDTLRQ